MWDNLYYLLQTNCPCKKEGNHRSASVVNSCSAV
nr:MAG TPA: hypothetical protein [Crassvirales sp.]